MCQCGCGERPVERAYELTRRCVLGIKVYDGCADCFPGLAVDLTVYNSTKVEWLAHLVGNIDKTVKPNEYGGTNAAIGIPIPIIETRDIVAQAKEMEADGFAFRYGDDEDEYFASLSEWLEEYGFLLLQGAARKLAKRMEAMEEERRQAELKHTEE